MNACAFSGNRPEKLPFGGNEESEACLQLKQRLLDEIEQCYLQGTRIFLCGMARGSDMWAGEAVVTLMRRYPDIQLWAVVPFPDYASGWKEEERGRYMDLLRHAQHIHYIGPRYTRGCFHRRNRYMVDHAALLIAVSSGAPGGTASTIAYAQRKGLSVRIITP